MSKIVKFEQNVPIQLALQTTQGLRIIRGRDFQILFVTVSGQKVYLPEETAKTIKRIVKSDEPFFVCRRRGRFDVWLSSEAEKARAAEEAPEVARQLRDNDFGGKGDVATPGGGRIRPAQPAFEKSAVTPPPVIPFPAPIPCNSGERESLKPTGTDSLPVPALQPHAGGGGHGDPLRTFVEAPRDGLGVRSKTEPVRIRPASTPPSRPQPPGRVGYGQVLHHITSTVKSVMAETGLALGDGPIQDLISTVFIAAQKDKAIDFDFGEAA